MSSKFPTIVTGFGFAPIAPAKWRDDPLTGLAYRDLALSQASEGALSGKHFRAAPAVVDTDGLIDPNAAFAFLFVLSAKVILTEGSSEAVTLRPLDCATRHGAGVTTALHFSHDAEAILLVATAPGASLFGVGNGKWVFCPELEEGYIKGNGVRTFYRYRSLEVDHATQRRVQNVPAFSRDYLVLEPSIPADYETTATPTPERA